jgi:riboflavin kinase/FMN adenylyltransferase|tara:strand:- start:52 stop:990 length:939 start_codon:yes stop_codon:yes gene_type:complete
MKIFYNPSISTNYKRSAIVIGNFDGLHKGHQELFKKTKKISLKNKIKFGVLTFTPLPVMFFNKSIKNFRLTSENEKIKLIKKYGADFLINIKFDKKFSKKKAEIFIKNIIYKKINPKFLSVSNNFKFGRNRKGNVKLLSRFRNKYNYQLLNIKPYRHKKIVVSSTRIRKSLQSGKIDIANKLLSRSWFVDGFVKRGKKLGRKLGFRTCNINIKDYILPKFGIYAVKVFIGSSKKIYNGIAYLGSRPTFKGKKVFLEVNLFKIQKNLYQKKLKVHFIKFVRKDHKFKNSAQLVRQMNKDVILAKKGLKAKIVI